MAKKKEKREGYGKLLDAWAPPDGAGAPIGCVATTFTFSSSFFEEECLSRFLGLETDPDEDGPLYLIEREEKLSQVVCACAIVDQHHCKGPRSLRWDLLPARVRGGILHAKISLLVWSSAVRVIIGSANLTEDGYRRNLEVFATFDYSENSDHPIGILHELVDFLRACADRSQSGPDKAAPPLERVRVLLDRVRNIAWKWGQNEATSLRQGMAAYPLLVRPGVQHALAALEALWPASTPPTEAYVCSPFFDPPDAPNVPAQELWQRLRKRGKASVSFHLEAEETVEGKLLVHAPKALLKARPSGRPGVETRVCKIDLESTRPLHAKAISLEDDRWVLYMIGSSNFTSAGLGLNSAGNLEANVAFLVDAKKRPKDADALDHAFPQGEELNPELIVWQDCPTSEDKEPEQDVALPVAFGPAIYDVDERESGSVTFSFAGTPKPGWRVISESDDEIILAEPDWTASGRLQAVPVPWSKARPPSGFWVAWEDSPGRAWWPVNVQASSALPPPDELKSLSLEVLIEILTSSRPLHRVLNAYLKRRHGSAASSTLDCLVDPHKRVDTSRFLLQRTRRVSWALTALRERLERPVATEKGLHWRLYGPVGVRALIDALLGEGQMPEEKTFLLTELALELGRVKPKSFAGHLPGQRVKGEIQKLIANLKDAASLDLDGQAPNLKDYVNEVYKAVLP